MNKKFSLLIILILFPIIIFSFHPPNAISVFIVHTNDIHGHIKPYPNNNGGMENLYTIITELRKEHNCDILVDAGDLIHKGDFIDRYSNGISTFKIFNKFHYDMFVIGNNELKVDYIYFKKFKKILKTPFVTFNIKKNHLLLADTPYIIKTIHGIKIALIGLGFDTDKNYVKNYNGWNNLEFLNVKEQLQKILIKLQNQVNFIILVSHNGLYYDQKMAKNFPQIKLIISAHDHRETPEPLINKNGQLFVETGCYLHNLGFMELIFNQKHQYCGYHYRLIPITYQYKNKIDNLIEHFDKKYNKDGNKVIGYLPNDLNTFEKSAQFTSNAFKFVSGADATIIDDGTEREFLSAGKITKEWIYMKSPYNDNVVVVKMKLKDFKHLQSNYEKNKKILPYKLYFSSIQTKNPSDTITVAMDSFIVNQLHLKYKNLNISVQDVQIKYLSQLHIH